ncbi:MAG: hypothetical protein IJ445_07275 [Clostridia bacterium]|jgi:uncharacterized protein YegP (UPF0339 family)|nr:hypothetical protein [Clostridia bacterium]MBQ8567364.1 hypothetical protein [Clostridia bacterium]
MTEIKSKRGYKYRVVELEDGTFRFELLPGNSNHIPSAYSTPYQTREAAMKGLEKFKFYMYFAAKRKINAKLVNLRDGTDKRHIYCIYFSPEETVSTLKHDRKEAKRCYKRILKHFNVPFRDDV